MSAIDEVFTRLRSAGRKAFIPFVTAGDPDLAFTADAIRELDRRGASVIEVGVPYSDPIADGPVIQASYTRALGGKVKLADILATLRGLKSQIQAPLATMVSYAIVLRHGAEQYVADAREAGVAGLIVPDLPVEEADGLAAVCRRADLSLIQLVAPTTPRERARRIAAASSGFLYYVSVAGITGERTALPAELQANVAWLRSQTPLPVCIGFGISQPEHVRRLAPAADGVIVGSALVRRMAEAATRPRAEALADMGQFAGELAAALEG